MHDYRLNPFTGNMETVEMVDFHIVPKNQPHYIRLRDIPEKGDPVTTVTVRPFVFVVDATIAIGATVINVDFDLSTPFKEGQVITIKEEKMQVSGVAASAISVLRGYDGTIPTVHNRPSATEPIIAYGPPFAEVPKEPGQGQYQPDYHTKPGGDESWNTGTIRFNPADAMTWVQVKYNSIGTVNSAEHTGNNALRDYGYKPEKDICAIVGGTIGVPVVVNCQLFYIRKGAAARAQYPGLLVRSTNGVIVSGGISAEGLIPAGWWGRGGGAGGHSGNGHVASHSGYYACQVLVYNGQTPNLEQQNAIIEAHKAFPIFNGGGGTSWSGAGGTGAGGAGGGGVTLISPYINYTGGINTGGYGGGGGDTSIESFAGGGGAGGGILLVGENIINSGTFRVAGAGGGNWKWKSGQNWGQAGGAGWVRSIEYGGRY